jgi:hypothetical protein
MCTMQTVHGVIRPLDRLAIEYPTCATILVLYTRSPTPTTILVAARHAALTTCTSRDKQT